MTASQRAHPVCLVPPTGWGITGAFSDAPRLTSFYGVTIGLLANGKASAAADKKVDEARPAVAERLDTAASIIEERAEGLPGQKVKEFAQAAADSLSGTADYMRSHDARRQSRPWTWPTRREVASAEAAGPDSRPTAARGPPGISR